MTQSSSKPASVLPDTEGKIKVLLVDDQPMIVEAVRRMLSDQDDIEFHYVLDAAVAHAQAEKIAPNVILQDLIMPGKDGFALIQEYRASERLKAVPVIVLSAREDPKLKAHGFAVGANDYVTKLPDRLELLARVRYHAAGHISRLQRDEAFRFLRESQARLADANIELQKLAALDGLTGIANRRRFDDAITTEWQRGMREQGPLSLIMCDVDSFKLYNDAYGHPAGDLCLKKTAAVLTEHLKRPADLVARYGGEEFAIVLPETASAGALQIASACRAHLAQLAIEHGGVAGGIVTASFGVATMLPSPGASVDQLIARADKALYAAKEGGRNCVSQAPE
ncbi:diguanylate cyclase domain-containing protein [Massilia sp. TSP1-1-2]|uniref:GGDEF domain-containing response regulator n=1 Tax=unclassified Massilia TaxID=2609279 RepID=UPI003CFAB83B